MGTKLSSTEISARVGGFSVGCIGLHLARLFSLDVTASVQVLIVCLFV